MSRLNGARFQESVPSISSKHIRSNVGHKVCPTYFPHNSAMVLELLSLVVIFSMQQSSLGLMFKGTLPDSLLRGQQNQWFSGEIKGSVASTKKGQKFEGLELLRLFDDLLQYENEIHPYQLRPMFTRPPNHRTRRTSRCSEILGAGGQRRLGWVRGGVLHGWTARGISAHAS